MSIHLRRDLEALHRDILSMCATVEDLVHKSVDLLASPDPVRTRELMERDDEVDNWDVHIEEECLKILALHQPVAADLRRITTIMKITGELERVADIGLNIAERASSLASYPQMAIPDRLDKMANLALDMLRKSIDAFVELDSALARHVCSQDDQVDQYNREIIDELVQLMHDTPQLLEPSMHMFSAARHVERVADHATNIAEDVVYLVEGEIIRHQTEL